jgi:nucleoside-diphosphate-sugar epimerase
LIRTPAAYGQVVNVCSGHAVSMRDLLSSLIAISGAEIPVQVSEKIFKLVDVPIVFGSPEKLERLLGYTPKTDLQPVLRAILAHCLGKA